MRLADITSNRWEFIISHAEKIKQGFLLHYQGVPYPRRVFWDAAKGPNYDLRVLQALGTVKKFLFGLVYLKNIVIPRTFQIQKYDTFLLKIGQICWWNLDEYFLKDDEWSEPVWEIGKFIRLLLVYLGFSEENAINWSKTGMLILEFDNAYRYRLQDLIALIDFVWLKANPAKELKRIIEIYLSREILYQDNMEWGAREKVLKLANFLKILFWLPKFKTTFLRAFGEIDLEKIKFDDNDRYHTSFWRGYNYEGKDMETRYQFFLDTHKGDFPPFHRKIDPNDTAKFILGIS